ncbi:response regulator [Deinococcus sp. KSM4-11]|uniref:ATP-binding protein n=1 Tax=Deinococcus sp. KSM4-11 TaxID=2568654 RepID=UPI0010A37BC2|nr:ATP-binding protein [Deinococcus sp. KSM4-11]THF85870.1 response regulator [Deinococcus sp. KSM4-11]
MSRPEPLRVLIVDDSPEDTEIFCRYLTRWPEQPVELHTALLGEDAVDILRATPPDLLLLDYSLPDMTGLEFLTVAHPDCAVIMLTGLGDERVAVSAMRAGAQDYLVKGQLKAEDLWRAAANAVERRSLERDLRREQQRSQAILDSVTDGVLSLDRDLNVSYLNPAAEQLLDVRAASILRQPLERALPWVAGTALLPSLQEAQRDQRTVAQEIHDPGSGRSLELRVYPAGDGLSVYVADITLRVQIQNRDRHATNRLRQLYSASLAMNTVLLQADVQQLIVDQARQVLGAHAAALALYVHPGEDLQLDLVATAGPTLDLPAPPARLPLDAAHPLAHVARDVEADRSDVAPLAPGDHPGTWTVLPVMQGGRPLGVLGVLDAPLASADDRTLLLTYAELCAQALDRATLVEAERQHRLTLERRVQERTAALERSNRELEQFAYVASHDLKEPLRTVSSFAQLLQGRHGNQLDERGQRYVTIVIEGAQRMFTLIEDVLAMARVSHAASPRTVNLDALLDDVISSLESLTRETGAQITVSSLPSVLGDPTQFVQLFQNLIGNALKFRQSGVPPRVQVSAQANPDGWQFTVADNGIGMESQYLKQVFTIFQRLHSRQAYPGNGIGLSVCQKIVESHGGRIWLDSTPGEGTSIHFTLPDRPVIPA